MWHSVKSGFKIIKQAYQLKTTDLELCQFCQNNLIESTNETITTLVNHLEENFTHKKE